MPTELVNLRPRLSKAIQGKVCRSRKCADEVLRETNREHIVVVR